MYNHFDELIQKSHYDELRREADQYRLIKLAYADKENCFTVIQRLFDWLGGRMINWGWQLKEKAGIGGIAFDGYSFPSTSVDRR